MSRARAAALRVALAAAAAVAVGGGARAAESPRWGSFELSLGTYRPRVDDDFPAPGPGPYAAAFGTGRGWVLRGDVAKALFTGRGSLEVGVGAGYFERYGKGLLPDGTRSGDATAFKVVPTRASLTYRLDWAAENLPVPLAPYARVSFERYNWWVTHGGGDLSNASGKKGYGATNGWSASGGLALLLDFFDRGLARDMDRDTGINHTYFFVDLTHSSIDDFGSRTSWDLSDTRRWNFSGGFLFVF